MRSLLIIVVLFSVLAGACSDGDMASEPEATVEATEPDPTTEATPDGPATFCAGVSNINDSLDHIGGTLIDAYSSGEADDLRASLADGVARMNETAALAPPELAESAETIAATYRDFQGLLEEIDYVIADLDVTDVRATAITDGSLTTAVVAVNEGCM